MQASGASVARACFLAGSFFLAVFLGGCAVITPQAYALKSRPPTGLPPRAELAGTPFFPDEDDQCGPASLATVLSAAGADVTPGALREEVYLPARRGSLQVEMLGAARRHGMVAYPLAPDLLDVLREVAAGNPVVVLQNYGVGWFPVWHYAVVIGYDLGEAELVLRSGTKPRLKIPFAVFEYTWKDGARWAMVAVPPERLPATATETGYVSAALALEKSGQPQAARTAYGTLLRRWPGNLAAQIGEGNTAYLLGDLKGAEAAFRQAAEAHPDAAAAFNNLAQTLADQGNLAEAARIARHAVSLGGTLRKTSEATLQAIRERQRAQGLAGSD